MTNDEIRQLNKTAHLPPRPELTDALKREVILKYIEDNPNWLKDAHIESCVDALVDVYSPNKDTFEMVKDLGRWHSWDTTRQDLDEIDGIDREMRYALRNAVKQWVSDNNIKQPLESGLRVECLSRRKTGVIEGICSYTPGCYSVIPDETPQNPTTRWICKFEQVRPVEGNESSGSMVACG